jgi:hypothetical protein
MLDPAAMSAAAIPRRIATGSISTRPITRSIQSFEPDEDWRWCYIDEAPVKDRFMMTTLDASPRQTPVGLVGATTSHRSVEIGPGKATRCWRGTDSNPRSPVRGSTSATPSIGAQPHQWIVQVVLVTT